MAFLMTFPPHKQNETFLLGGMHAEETLLLATSTVKGLKMHMIHHWLLDVTQDIQLSRQYATTLVGPTPSRLVPANVPSIEALEDFMMLHWMQPIGEYEHEGIYKVKPQQEGK
ncbi:hypothetical protein EDD16DRAFT_1527868 [Pisolithus croceorrhizus]|nr:hypothetical protein EDD16DRAFT_1527868 [Pisolithus croceorrhizus]KAI6108492.1 hypothetical protein EV401DRAFT_1891853 [Pisolithus croceorrhizus]KAI6156191.1 hypothetical protein EDD17DRAFT_1512656 [Pisolithus thermaeus]